jgi:PAS domain S-box-containing protein
MESVINPSSLLQTALELSPTAALIADTGGEIVLVNRELERQFGYAREELVGQLVDLLVPEGLRPLAAELFHAAETTLPDTGRELIARRRDGSPVAVEIGLQPLQTRDHDFVLASIIDVGERRRQEDARREALEERLEFERFFADLSFQFINVPADGVDEAIRNGLGRIGAQLGLDRSLFCRIDSDGVMSDVIAWTAPGIPALDSPVSGRDLFPWVLDCLLAAKVVSFSSLDDIPSAIDRASYRAAGTQSAVVVPLAADGGVVGALGFSTVRAERTWAPEVVHRLTVIGSVFDQVLARHRRDAAMRAASLELERLRHELRVENVFLRQEEHERLGTPHVVGQSEAIQRVLKQIHQVAATDATVLLRGETGTGKELFAACIHELGARRARPMVRVNCAAIPATLIESELFGREKGAFTGALARQLGRFELASHSTIFLDEIGDLPSDVQVKLLRVLEERTIERLGNPRPIAIDTRILAATHRNLEQLTAEGVFREDLYYRLNVFPIDVPPLRERLEDIPLLLWRFVEEFSKAFGKRIDSIDMDTVTALQAYSWPGNIRELRNVVERAMIVATSRRLSIVLPSMPAPPPRHGLKLVDVETEHIRGVLESAGWRIRGAGGAAEQLGLKPTTLETRIAKLGLKRAAHR